MIICLCFLKESLIIQHLSISYPQRSKIAKIQKKCIKKKCHNYKFVLATNQDIFLFNSFDPYSFEVQFRSLWR